jgi:hypothetical protein
MPTAVPTATPLSTRPILVSPRGVITTTKPTFTWQGVPGAVAYRLWVNEYAIPNVPGKINRVYSVQSLSRDSQGRFRVSPGVSFAYANAEWWITAIMADGREFVSASATFTVRKP